MHFLLSTDPDGLLIGSFLPREQHFAYLISVAAGSGQSLLAVILAARHHQMQILTEGSKATRVFAVQLGLGTQDT